MYFYILPFLPFFSSFFFLYQSRLFFVIIVICYRLLCCLYESLKINKNIKEKKWVYTELGFYISQTFACIRDMRVQILIWFHTFLRFAKPCCLNSNALKSTSFQAFQIISDFFRLFLTDALSHTPDVGLCIPNCENSMQIFNMLILIMIMMRIWWSP